MGISTLCLSDQSIIFGGCRVRNDRALAFWLSGGFFRIEKIVMNGEEHKLQPIRQAQFFEYLRDMPLDCALSNGEIVCNSFAGAARYKPGYDLQFAGGKVKSTSRLRAFTRK